MRTLNEHLDTDSIRYVLEDSLPRTEHAVAAAVCSTWRSILPGPYQTYHGSSLARWVWSELFLTKLSRHACGRAVEEGLSDGALFRALLDLVCKFVNHRSPIMALVYLEHQFPAVMRSVGRRGSVQLFRRLCESHASEVLWRRGRLWALIWGGFENGSVEMVMETHCNMRSAWDLKMSGNVSTENTATTLACAAYRSATGRRTPAHETVDNDLARRCRLLVQWFVSTYSDRVSHYVLKAACQHGDAQDIDALFHWTNREDLLNDAYNEEPYDMRYQAIHFHNEGAVRALAKQGLFYSLEPDLLKMFSDGRESRMYTVTDQRVQGNNDWVDSTFG